MNENESDECSIASFQTEIRSLRRFVRELPRISNKP